MNFETPEWIAAQLIQIQQFMDQKLIPIEHDIIHSDFFKVEQQLKDLREEVKKMGLWAPHIPAEIGGCGKSLTQLAFISEVLGQSPLGHYTFGC